MQVSAKLFSYALLPIWASLVSISFAKFTSDKQLIQFMSGFTNVKQTVHKYELEYGGLNQIYDHLDRTNTKWFEQVHFKNDNFGTKIDPEYGFGPPVFVIVGGFSPLTEPDVKNPLWTEMIQRVKGYAFMLEHRYFGKSFPTEPTTEGYARYLSSEQALYDIAYLIGVWRQTFYKSRWVIVGEGHGGKLAARFRMKFPNLVDGALAVNAPLIPKMEFNEFFEHVSLQLSIMDSVKETIRAAYDVVDKDIANQNIHLLKDKLRLCDDPSDLDTKVEKKNIQYMLWSITWNLGLITILKDTKRVLYETKIKQIFTDSSVTDPVEKLSNALEVILSRNGLNCVHVKYQEAVEYLKKPEKESYQKFITLTTGLGNREQFWNSCTEFGYMKTSTKENMFGDVPLDFFLGLCTDTFGEWYNKSILEKSIEKTHIFYDVTNMAVSNILFITHTGVAEENLAITDPKGNPNINIFKIPDIPNTPGELTQITRDSLRDLYNKMYKYIQQFAGSVILDEAKIRSLKVQDVDDRIQTDEQLIQFMVSFSQVKRYYLKEADSLYITFHQRFNHLDRRNHKTWGQDIYMNEEFYEFNKPAFLFIGDLVEHYTIDYQDPLWTEIAQRNKGVLFGMEYRCHGDTYPPTKTVAEYFQICSSEQLLYDIAYFIGNFQNTYPSSKWIVVGEGHGGKIAAWSRFKFPGLISGAIAMNAPLVPQKEFKEYFDSVSEKLSRINVMDTIKQAYAAIENDVINNRLDILKDKLRLCDYPEDLTNEEQKKNIQFMLWSITWVLGNILKLKDESETIKQRTDVLQTLTSDLETDPVKRLEHALSLILNYRYNLECIDVDYKTLVESLKTPGSVLGPIVKSGIGTVEKFWLSCTEFGYMKTSTKENMFGDVPLDFFIGLCTNVFGQWYNEDILNNSMKTTERFYNGKNFDATNIVFFNHVDDSKKLFAFNKNDNHQNFNIFEVEDVPDTLDKYSVEELNDLRKQYDSIFKSIQVLTGVNHLESPNVYTASLIPEVEEVVESDEEQEKKHDDAAATEGIDDDDGDQAALEADNAAEESELD